MMKTSARYDKVADFYESFAPDRYDDPSTVTLLRLLGDVSGLRLLDFACGHGRISRELARRGAQVVGIDISSALLEKARARETAEPMGIEYVNADVTSPDVLEGELVQRIVCHFSLMDIDNLAGAVATVARLLGPGGYFVFSLLHPCFPGSAANHRSSSWPPGRGYYEEGWWVPDGPPQGIRPKVGANHRMLSTYLNTLARAGFLVDEVDEPTPSPEWIQAAAGEDPVPIYWVAKYRKQ